MSSKHYKKIYIVVNLVELDLTTFQELPNLLWTPFYSGKPFPSSTSFTKLSFKWCVQPGLQLS